jgi:hypothetical protein
MKKFILTLFLTGMLFSAKSQVNDYLNNAPVWQQTSSCSAPAPCIKNENYNYYISGDTVINPKLSLGIISNGRH